MITAEKLISLDANRTSTSIVNNFTTTDKYIVSMRHRVQG